MSQSKKQLLKRFLITVRSLPVQLQLLIKGHVKQCFAYDYKPVPGKPSEKAMRLVDYCLGDNKDKPVKACTNDLNYLKNRSIFHCQFSQNQIELFLGWAKLSTTGKINIDHKKIINALISQRAEFPNNLSCWIVRGDSHGRHSNPAQGLHLAGMRSKNRRDLVLVPTANRNRFTGPELLQQLHELASVCPDWNDKTDTAWWGGALTGDRWQNTEPYSLTRRQVLTYYQEHPTDKVILQMTAANHSPPGIALSPKFTRQDAFRHKCLVLLPGNDIASGSSWYFAGNSVVMMPPPHLEHILFFEIEPWVHYVPLENNPADILVKLQWVLDHPQEAQQIIKNSHERLMWLCGEEYQWACNEVLRRLTA